MKIQYRQEYQNNSKFKYSKQDAIEFIIKKGYGATILYEELEKIFALSISDEDEFKKLKSAVGNLKPILINYGIVLKTIVNVGYYILKPKQISGYCYHAYIRKTEKLLRKSEIVLKHVDKTYLSDIRLKEYKEVCELNDDMNEVIEQTIDNSKYERNKEIYKDLDD